MRKARLTEPFLTCRNILEELMDSDDAIPFNSPVDSTLTDYYKIVKNPMDLGSIWVIVTSCNDTSLRTSSIRVNTPLQMSL